MNTRLIITNIIAIFIAGSGRSQNPEVADSLVRELQEVVVAAKQHITKLVGSTLVSTIPGSNLADLGNALDVLDQLPMIKVEDNAVTVIGKSNVEIYIDGRPMCDGRELRQLRSSNLKKVELLMAPGAAYASTTGAVLKITTRRNFIKGLSVTDQFRLQRRRKWYVTDHLGLSYRIGEWEMFADGTVNLNNSLVRGTTVNRLNYDGKATVVGGSQSNSYPVTAGSVKAGFNYSGGSQSFGAYYRYNPELGRFNNSGAEWLDDNPAVRRQIDRRTKGRSHLALLYYENRFAENCQLHFDGDFSRFDADNSVATSYPQSVNPDVNSTDRRKSVLWAGKLSLKFPLWRPQWGRRTATRTHHSITECLTLLSVNTFPLH